MAVGPYNYDFANEVRLLVVGKTGAGKSTTCNAILGFPAFEARPCLRRVTSKTGFQTAERFGKTLVVVDTPGVKDTEKQDEEVLQEINKWYALLAPGIHAVLFVLKGDRFTKEEEDTIAFFMNHFGDNLKKYLIVVFTNKDDLVDSNISLQEFIKSAKSSSNLQKLLDVIGERCVSIGRFWGTKQDREAEVQEIMSMVYTLREQNGNDYFSNKHFEKIETFLEEHERTLIQDHIRSSRTSSSTRNQIRMSIFNREKIFFLLLAGIGLTIKLLRR